MAVRKIDLMHRQFGLSPGNKCKDCSNLTAHFYDKRYYKCTVYGESASEATDWVLKWDACGMFNKDWHGNPIVHLVRPKKIDRQPIAGQKSFWEDKND